MARSRCSVDGCDGVSHGKGLCLAHYNKWRKYGDPLVVKRNQARRGMPQAERFWGYVDRSAGPDGCWLWLAGKDPQHGYGRFTLPAPKGSGLRSTYIGAHRYSYQLEHGVTLTTKEFVCHRCDNPPCVNPAHLFVGSQADNIRDMDLKGRRRGNQPKGEAHHRARLTDDLVLELRRRRACGESIRAAAIEFGVSQEAAWLVAAGRTWKHLNDVPVPGWTLPTPRVTSPRGLVGTGEEHWHGTVSGSSYHLCGCDRCHAAVQTYRRARRVVAKPA